ncbi:MAG: helix-turn-helix domain-containing protein [Myxococcaceae bacterium]
MPNALRKPVYTFKEAAKKLGVRPRALTRLVRTMEVLTVRVRGREMVPRSEIVAFREASC